MPPYLSDHFRTIDPNYQRGFADGFKAAKAAALRDLMKAVKEIKQEEPFRTYMATTSLS